MNLVRNLQNFSKQQVKTGAKQKGRFAIRNIHLFITKTTAKYGGKRQPVTSTDFSLRFFNFRVVGSPQKKTFRKKTFCQVGIVKPIDMLIKSDSIIPSTREELTSVNDEDVKKDQVMVSSRLTGTSEEQEEGCGRTSKSQRHISSQISDR